MKISFKHLNSDIVSQPIPFKYSSLFENKRRISKDKVQLFLFVNVFLIVLRLWNAFVFFIIVMYKNKGYFIHVKVSFHLKLFGYRLDLNINKVVVKLKFGIHSRIIKSK